MIVLGYPWWQLLAAGFLVGLGWTVSDGLLALLALLFKR